MKRIIIYILKSDKNKITRINCENYILYIGELNGIISEMGDRFIGQRAHEVYCDSFFNTKVYHDYISCCIKPLASLGNATFDWI